MITLHSIGIPIGQPEWDAAVELDSETLMDAVFILSDCRAFEASPISDGRADERRWLIAKTEFMDSLVEVDEDALRGALCLMHDQIIDSQTEAIIEEMPTDSHDDGATNEAWPALDAWYEVRVASCSNMGRHQIRRELPYAAGLQLIHADLVWQRSKTRWVRDRIQSDARSAEQREQQRHGGSEPQDGDILWNL